MPPELPHHVLLALGLVACPGTRDEPTDLSPCLSKPMENVEPDTEPPEVTPCLAPVMEVIDEDSEPAVHPCLKPIPEPPPKPELGPCLSPPHDPDPLPLDGGRTDEPEQGTDAGDVLRRLERRGVLPDDILQRLKRS